MSETYFEYIGTDKMIFTNSGVKNHVRNPYNSLVELCKSLDSNNKFLKEHFDNSVTYPVNTIEYDHEDEYYYDEDKCAWIVLHSGEYHVFV